MTRHESRSQLEWALITLILLIAALLRFHDLGNIPKGLEHDEVATWHMVARVLEGERPIYFEEGYGHEPLLNYLTAIPMSIFGHNWLGERFWAPWFGVWAVAATYALMRRMFNPLVGLSTAGFQATVLWALFFNRLGLRLNQLPFLLCVTAYCFWRGLELTSGTFRAAGSKGWRDSPLDVPADKRRFACNLWLPLRATSGCLCVSPQVGARLAWFVAAGALMGLCLYTYTSSRVIPLVFATYSIYLIAHDLWIDRSKSNARPGWRQLLTRWWPILACFVVAGLVVTPLALYMLDRPADVTTPQREGQVDRPLRELEQGNLRPILENAWALLKMWNLDGERYWQLNYSHRPVFVEPISGYLFWIGALIVLWRWKDPRMALLAIWIGLGLIPSLITSQAPSWPRTMLASPAALALPGIAVSITLEFLDAQSSSQADQDYLTTETQRARRLSGEHLGVLWASAVRLLGLRRCSTIEARSDRMRILAPATLVSLLVLSIFLTAARTYRDFLVVWPKHPRVRYAFQSSLTEALRYLDATDDAMPVVMTGLSPHDVDPWTERSTLRRRDLSIRWVDARSALVLPRGNVARLILLDIIPIDPLLSSWAGLTEEAVLVQGEVVPRGGTEHDVDAPVYYDPAYTVYRLDVAALGQRVQSAQHQAYVGSDPFDAVPCPAAPQFGGLVRLIGYEWLTQPKPGAPAHLLTFWTALGAGPSSTLYGEAALRTFVHLLDRGQVVGGVDVLGAAPDTWLAGDVIVQLHTFAYPGEPGHYAVELGWYVPPDGPRLPIDGVDVPGQRILLERVELKK